jgi:hypothetical protein
MITTVQSSWRILQYDEILLDDFSAAASAAQSASLINDEQAEASCLLRSFSSAYF